MELEIPNIRRGIARHRTALDAIEQQSQGQWQGIEQQLQSQQQLKVMGQQLVMIERLGYETATEALQIQAQKEIRRLNAMNQQLKFQRELQTMEQQLQTMKQQSLPIWAQWQEMGQRLETLWQKSAAMEREGKTPSLQSQAQQQRQDIEKQLVPLWQQLQSTWQQLQPIAGNV
jgi:hypothetical protein